MKNIVRHTIGFLGVAFMASTQIFGATQAARFTYAGPSILFEQAMPVTPAQKEVQRLLKEISAKSAIASDRAETLASFNSVATRLGSISHASQLNGAKDAINSMGADYRQLQDLRPVALPWQQSVIDRVHPMLTEMAANATRAIEQLGEGGHKVPARDYRNAVDDLRSSAGAAHALVSENLKYAHAREKLNRLGD